MMMRYLLFPLLLLIGSLPLHAQDTPLAPEQECACGTTPSLFAGYHGINDHYVEFGYARLPSPDGGITCLGYSISTVYRLDEAIFDNRFLIGIVASLWSNLLVGPGISLEYDHDLRGCFLAKLRPELALRTDLLHAAYGYDFVLDGHGYTDSDTHNLSVRLFF